MAKLSGNKPHIGIFGSINSGKSTLLNGLVGQEAAIVSKVAGTTTDPVKKGIEITDVGAVVLIDTAGVSDTGRISDLRMQKTFHTIKNIDLAILLITNNEIGDSEKELIAGFQKYSIPFFFIHNKKDIANLSGEFKKKVINTYKTDIIDITALNMSTFEMVFE